MAHCVARFASNCGVSCFLLLMRRILSGIVKIPVVADEGIIFAGDLNGSAGRTHIGYEAVHGG